MTLPGGELEKVARIPGLWRHRKGHHNAYALVDGGHALVIDGGHGGMFEALQARDITVDAALVSHPAKSAMGELPEPPLRVLAPAGAGKYLSPAEWTDWKTRSPGLGIWDNYEMPDAPREGIEYILSRGNDFLWRGFRVQSLPTPGQTPLAISLLVHWHGSLLVFCGDAVAEGGVLWHPHHLEWNHWSADGLRAAAEGLERLLRVDGDALLPAHGKPVLRGCAETLKTARTRLRAWIRAKESPAKGQRVSWLEGEAIAPQVLKLAPWLYQVGANGYLIRAKSGEALLVDVNAGEWEWFQGALRDAGGGDVRAILATHYHVDHAGALDEFHDLSGAEIWLTAEVARILEAPEKYDLPFRPPALKTKPARILEIDDPLDWGEFRITAWDFPGQTRAHAAFHFQKAGGSVLFSGDNFFPPERWFGSGGCSVANQTCPEYYARSAALVLKARPEWICAGHRAPFVFSREYFRRIIRWAKEYRTAIERLQHRQDRSGYRSLTGASDIPAAASRSRL